MTLEEVTSNLTSSTGLITYLDVNTGQLNDVRFLYLTLDLSSQKITRIEANGVSASKREHFNGNVLNLLKLKFKKMGDEPE